jgi:3alpha(or 20beta)-hydroxysteroid dehydrogenase
MPDFTGLSAIITGAAQGQGRAEAHRLIADGCAVVIGDVLDDLGQAAARELGPKARYVHLDVTNASDWDGAVTAAAEVGSLQVLVNNAALSWQRAFEDETAETMERMWRVNLLGPFLGTQAVLASMRAAGRGSVVNISSVAGLQGLPYHSAYGASKWALRGFTKTCAIELGQYGIRVNSVHPGPIDTTMLPAGPPGTTLEQRYRHLPLGRVGQVDEVAELVAYLASADSEYITGAEFVIDGGLMAGPPMPANPPYAALGRDATPC